MLDVRDLRVNYAARGSVVKAVDGATFSLHRGETLGVVGESGCGKSTLALALMGMVPAPAGRVVGGRVILDGDDLLGKTPVEMQRIRGRKISMIIQDPMTSLNPVFTLGEQVTETLQLHFRERPAKLASRAVDWLRRVRIASAETRLASYPHQLSGGMRQRAAAVMALVGSPQVLIADEPTTALDATIQYQYLLLLKELQAATGMAIIFITHDFGIVATMCDRVAVMYAGRIVESSPVDALFERPAHPYTEALLRSVPNVEEDVDVLYSIEGQPPSLDRLPSGCSFAPRCAYVFERCTVAPPALPVPGAIDRQSACWRCDAGRS